ncbi:hypothetical protein I2I05_19085 [Hymenobacter sp. BT683]|uniref:Uncharacterized protein n=1 Tax=Hymenobacter jeongseonensis TaxID=2791027 RepID=A0ABS0IMA9_9BACT|nr:hypothetical protein [Hymenobacter jeongseonensis]MBF9239506.1 hypothetical protein [Hymenobacter jeongseonensis]
MFTKHAPKLLVLLLTLLIGGGIIAAKSPAEPKQYDYVTVVLYNRTTLTLSYKDRFEEKKVAFAGEKHVYNFTPLLAQIGELEAQGYELVVADYQPGSESSRQSNYALLRKPR